MKNDLSKMSEKELLQLQGEIAKALKALEKNRLSDARKAAEDAARKHGFSLTELLGKPKNQPGQPQFANPADPRQTWTGKGRQPLWIKAALAEGKSLDDMRI